MSRIDEALRKIEPRATVAVDPNGPDFLSEEFFQRVVELDDYIAEDLIGAGRPEQASVDLSELEAMQALSETLGGLADPDARARVLRWMNESFGQDERPPSGREREPARERESVVSMIHDFVADFQQLAKDWDACGDQLS